MKKKLSLSNTQTQEYNANTKRLIAVGTIPPEEKPSAESQMLTVEQTGGPTDSFVHASPVGGYGIAVWLRFVAVKSGISLCDFQVKPQRWSDTNIFLVDAAEGVLPYRALGGVEYPRTDVLNPWIASDRCLRHGQVLKGVVIAQSFASLPARYQSGISIDMELCFFDQFDNIYPLKVELMVIRDKRDERPRRSTGLFGPAVNASMHGTYGEKPDLGGREGISPKEPRVPRPNGPIPKYQRFI
jgi:hypothetical protein